MRRRPIALCLAVGAALVLVGAASAGNGGFAPETPHSPNAARINDSYKLIALFTGIVLVLVEASLIAFVIRYRGRVHAYLNECRHQCTELDWNPGEFFDAERLYLVCATHGALYEPDSGLCVDGPCRGARLAGVAVIERNGAIYCSEE